MRAGSRVTLKAWRLALIATFGLALPLQAAAPPRPTEVGSVAPAPIKEAVWKAASKGAVTSAEIDRLIAAGLKKANLEPAPLTTDEQFVRRVYLDVVGRPPGPDAIRTFVEDKDAQKRSKLISKLLDDPAFGRHWARFWHDVMSAHLVNNFQGQALGRYFDAWMAEQINKNVSWAELTREMLTASGQAKFDNSDGKAGKAYFLASHMGADAVTEQAAETSRVFLGIQINCAQCHDHPFDVWKREQFHELAAYFARVRTRLVRDPDSERIRFIGIDLASVDRGGGMGFGGGGGRGFGGGEYRLPDKDNANARNGKIIHPRPLYGKAPQQGLKDSDRRKALVDSIVDEDNYWFSAAFVNRVWGVLLGQSFYQPVDDLGPNREAVHGAVLARLAGSFSGSKHDVKKLFEVILNSETYQRQSKVGRSRGDHLYFASSYPTRLRPSALSASVTNAIGSPACSASRTR